METSCPPKVLSELEHYILVRTGWRVRDLSVEVRGERVVLRGRATTHFTRRLAQHAVQDVLPQLRLENALEVDNSVEFLLGMPLN
jgi:hypothetical protein